MTFQSCIRSGSSDISGHLTVCLTTLLKTLQVPVIDFIIALDINPFDMKRETYFVTVIHSFLAAQLSSVILVQ